jgi:hypothetical protein
VGGREGRKAGRECKREWWNEGGGKWELKEGRGWRGAPSSLWGGGGSVRGPSAAYREPSAFSSQQAHPSPPRRPRLPAASSAQMLLGDFDAGEFDSSSSPQLGIAMFTVFMIVVVVINM